MKYAFVACALLLACGCTTEPQVFLRDSDGRLIGPIPLKPGAFVPADYGSYMIDEPRPGELDILSRLEATVLPAVAFSNAPLAEVEQILYAVQRQTVGDRAVPVHFDASSLTLQTNAVPSASGAVAATEPNGVTFSAKYIALSQTLRILGHLTGLTYRDIRNGTVTLRRGRPADCLPGVTGVPDPVDRQVTERFQQEIDSVRRMLAGFRTPEHLSLGKSDQRRFVGEFDTMSFFRVFTSISMQDGYVLDYVQTQWGMGSGPQLYTRQTTVGPYARPVELAARDTMLKSNAVAAASVQFDHWREVVLSAGDCGESEAAMLALCRELTHITLDGSGDEYLAHVVIPDRPIAYLECVALYLLGEQFYLGWHAGYNDTRIVCTRTALAQLLSEPDVSATLNEDDRFVLSSIDPTPSMRELGDAVHLSLVTFSKWGGLTRRRYVITRRFPHALTVGAADSLWEHICGGDF